MLYIIRGRNKWLRLEESVQIALRTIQNVLYEIPGYEQAEKSGNRNEQVKIINDLVRRESRLVDYFIRAGLKSLMDYFIDPTGSHGLKKQESPRALLEFYSDKKGLNWFDRSQTSYVESWRMTEKNMWQMGEESVVRAIQAIEDVLYSIEGYKDAERLGNINEQLRLIGELKKRIGLQSYFYEQGLTGLMFRFFDPKGEYGISKKGSPVAVLEFYSRRKGLNWFDQTQSTYLTSDRKGNLIVMSRTAA